MSTRIIDRIEAIKLPLIKPYDSNDYTIQTFILCELGGDNNVISNDTGKRVRSWSAVALGDNCGVIQEICIIAGYFEGGMVRFASGSGTPESYIKRCRKALSDARGLNQSDLRASFEIRFDEEEKASDRGKYHYDELIKAGMLPSPRMCYGKNEDVFYFSTDQLSMWYKGIHGRAWRNVIIGGPK